MVLVLVVLLAALAVGRLSGGSVRALGDLPVREARLVLLALAAQLAGVVLGGPLHPLGLAVSAALVLAFLARNRGLRGVGLVTLGLLANALVVLANGAMPVSADGAARAGVGTSALLGGGDPRHELSDPGTRLPWLGDVVPVPLPGFPLVASAGDVLVAAGAAQLVVAGMRRAATDAQGRQRRALPPLDVAVRTARTAPRARAPGARRTGRP